MMSSFSAIASDSETPCTCAKGTEMAQETAEEIHETSGEIEMEYFDGFWSGGTNCSVSELDDDTLEKIAKAYDRQYGSITGAGITDPRRKYARIQFLEFLKWKRGGGGSG